MRVGTRITLTTSLVVMTTLGLYGWVTVRSLRAEREAAMARDAREMAITLRTVIEAQGFDNVAATEVELRQGLEQGGIPWTVALLDARDAPAEGAPPPKDPHIERLQRALAVRAPFAEEERHGDRSFFIYVEPVRVEAPFLPDGFRVVGALQLTRDLQYLDEEMTDAAIDIFSTMAVLVFVLVLAITFVARRAMGRPIAKLIAGIDDVAKGDLSGVLLQEREDEIGALAARFNAMTASLREARAETRRSLDQMRQTDKLATIGRVAAEIAHEVGTPLNVVTGRARGLAKKAGDTEAVQKNAIIIAEQAQRIARIIQRLLDYARRRAGESEHAPVPLNRLASDTLEFLEHQIANARLEVRLELARDLETVPGDRDQLQQVLLNLYMNAIQAMPQGGALTVRTGRVLRRRPGLEVAPEQEYAFVAVSDTGVGIAEGDREKVFEAFYTSKGDSGTGLGLAVAKGIVHDHDGWIEIADNRLDGRGSEFRVFLPLTEAMPVAASRDDVSAPPDGRTSQDGAPLA